MTPKEKAQELYLKHRSIIAEKQLVSNFMLISEVKKLTKKSALISVDELLNNFLSNRTTEYGRERYHFWQQVKKEIKDI